MPHVPIGEPVHVERLPGAVLLRDGDAAVVGVDRDHLGGVAVVAGSDAVVAGELEPIAGAELDRDLGIALGLIAAHRAGDQATVLPCGETSDTVPASASTASTR